MRKLIAISGDTYVRNFLDTDAFAVIEDDETAYLVSDAVTRLDAVEGRGRGVTVVKTDTPERARAYYEVRMIWTAALRSRSQTMRMRIRRLRLRERLPVLWSARPGRFAGAVQRRLDRVGLNPEVEQALDDMRPELIVVPTAGTDVLAFDLLRSAHARQIPTLALVNGWDNMSSKFVFSVQPDYLCVWGEQSVRHARDIHGIDPERVFVTGVPTFDAHLRFDPAEAPSPYPFPYVLFAGGSMPFDELAALRRLDRLPDELGRPDLRIVYRPHPERHFRRCPDVVLDEDFVHVVLDEQVREPYLAAAAQGLRVFDLPALDWYPALLGHAEAMVCPLSTMLVEAALVDTPVVVLAYNDGIHKEGLDEILAFDHFEGIDRIAGLTIAGGREEMVDQLRPWLTGSTAPDMRSSVDDWLHLEDTPFAARLAAVVDRVAGLSRTR